MCTVVQKSLLILLLSSNADVKINVSQEFLIPVIDVFPYINIYQQEKKYQ